MIGIDSNREQTSGKILNEALLPVRQLLPFAEVESRCRELHYAWRDRVFNPLVTLLACIWKHLQAGPVSARATEDFVLSLMGPGTSAGSRDVNDFAWRGRGSRSKCSNGHPNTRAGWRIGRARNCIGV